MGAIERMYRQFWRRKGDVFHLLLGLALTLDDRIWPKEDEEDVQLFASLVYHVTGIKMKAAFAREDEPLAVGLWGRLGHIGHVTGKVRHKFGARGRVAAWFRRHHIRFKAHIYPYNSGLTAGEALMSPLFHRDEGYTPPPPPAPLRDVFPRCNGACHCEEEMPAGEQAGHADKT